MCSTASASINMHGIPSAGGKKVIDEGGRLTSTLHRADVKPTGVTTLDRKKWRSYECTPHKTPLRMQLVFCTLGKAINTLCLESSAQGDARKWTSSGSGFKQQFCQGLTQVASQLIRVSRNELLLLLLRQDTICCQLRSAKLSVRSPSISQVGRACAYLSCSIMICMHPSIFALVCKIRTVKILMTIHPLRNVHIPPRAMLERPFDVFTQNSMYDLR